MLWGILAIATGIAASATLAQQYVINDIVSHSAVTAAYTAVGLWLAPALLTRLHGWRLNILIKASPKGYIFVVLFAYIGAASLLGVNLVFGAFLAGFGLIGGIKGSARARFTSPLDAITKVSFSFSFPSILRLSAISWCWVGNFLFRCF